MEQVLKEKCPQCGSTNLIHDYDSSETVCGDCGFVVQEKEMDKRPEWRAFTPEQQKSRTRAGAPQTPTIHDKGTSTSVGFPREDKDAEGRKVSPQNLPQIHRLRKWQARSRVHSSEERNLAQAMNELNHFSDKHSIPKSVKGTAAVIYRKAIKKGLCRGREISILVVAALYFACRLTGTRRTLNEMAGLNEVIPGDSRENRKKYRKKIAHAYRFLIRELDIQMPIVKPVDCISKIAEKVGISGETQGLAIRILLDAKKKRLQSGRDPMGFAGAALYIACL